MCHSLPVTVQTRGHLTDGYMSKWPALAIIADATANDHLWLPYTLLRERHMSHFAYACKTEGKNGISCLISGLCVNCLISIPEYSRLNHLDVHLV